MAISRTSYTHQRPAPRKAPGKPPHMADTVTWTRIVEPRERYRIAYIDRDNQRTERTIELLKIGNQGENIYLSVIDTGRPKTLRADRIVFVLEQLTQGHAASIEAQPGYATRLPAFPVSGAVYRIKASSASSNRHWSVDLNAYTCTCPEKRLRSALGYAPGTLGFVCPHMARAILDHLPESAGWPHGLLAFLRSPRKIAVDNLS